MTGQVVLLLRALHVCGLILSVCGSPALHLPRQQGPANPVPVVGAHRSVHADALHRHLQVWVCQLDHLKLYTDYVLNVTSVSAQGNSTRLTSFMVEDIVKPDSPVELRVSPGGPRKLVVEWSPPPTWSNLDVFPLKYRLRYRWSNRPRNHTVQLGPYESTRVALGGLVPGRAYLFQVCAMELLDLGQCSEWSPPVEMVLPSRRH
ncbi:hypothetical protein NHX12_019990 [Muraenolepis orangiensis]|uniref:Fibronectin type-III domain-containing protein n=1 Tax=Muraenolepis orangiensis TaxID=630683 RepID=A0A9Q0EV09_9TELE|nr:hypothetical protein NHX12_019990 [Muraenolepis orangiensis]